MSKLWQTSAILGLDPTSRGIAFAFFERGKLLDWGTRRNDGDEMSVVDRLLETYRPDTVVIEDPDAHRCERRSRVRALLRRIAVRARTERINVILVSRYAVREDWKSRGFGNKHGVAKEIAKIFPEIEHLLPRRRKPYQSEQVRSDIFDAISIVVRAFGVEADAAVELVRRAA